MHPVVAIYLLTSKETIYVLTVHQPQIPFASHRHELRIPIHSPETLFTSHQLPYSLKIQPRELILLREHIDVLTSRLRRDKPIRIGHIRRARIRSLRYAGLCLGVFAQYNGFPLF